MVGHQPEGGRGGLAVAWRSPSSGVYRACAAWRRNQTAGDSEKMRASQGVGARYATLRSQRLSSPCGVHPTQAHQEAKGRAAVDLIGASGPAGGADQRAALAVCGSRRPGLRTQRFSSLSSQLACATSRAMRCRSGRVQHARPTVPPGSLQSAQVAPGTVGTGVLILITGNAMVKPSGGGGTRRPSRFYKPQGVCPSCWHARQPFCNVGPAFMMRATQLSFGLASRCLPWGAGRARARGLAEVPSSCAAGCSWNPSSRHQVVCARDESGSAVAFKRKRDVEGKYARRQHQQQAVTEDSGCRGSEHGRSCCRQDIPLIPRCSNGSSRPWRKLHRVRDLAPVVARAVKRGRES